MDLDKAKIDVLNFHNLFQLKNLTKKLIKATLDTIQFSGYISEEKLHDVNII